MVDADAEIVFEPGLHGGEGAFFMDHRQLARPHGRSTDEGDSVRARAVAVAAFVAHQFGDLSGGTVVHDRRGDREGRLHDLLRIVVHGGGDVTAVGRHHHLAAVVAHQPVFLVNKGAFAVIDDFARSVPVTAELVGPVGAHAEAVGGHGLDNESGIGFLSRKARCRTGEVFDPPVDPLDRFEIAARSHEAGADGSVGRDSVDGAHAVTVGVVLLPCAVAIDGRKRQIGTYRCPVVRDIVGIQVVGLTLFAIDRIIDGLAGFDVID